MDDSKIAFYSGVLQIIPVLLLAVFLGDRRRLHPNIARKQRFTAPGWALTIVGAAAVAMVAAAVALYADVDSLPIVIIIAAVMVVLFVGLLGTAFELAKSANEERRAQRGDESTSADEGVDTGL